MWIKDPTTKEPSVSLSLMLVSFLITIIVSVLQVSKNVDNGGMSFEILALMTSLYFGRRFSVKTKNMEASSDGPTKEKSDAE